MSVRVRRLPPLAARSILAPRLMLATLLTLSLAPLLGCNNEITLPRPQSFGLIEGQALAGGKPVSTNVSIAPPADRWGWGAPGAEITVKSDSSTGHYSIQAPIGSCFLRVGDHYNVHAYWGRFGPIPGWGKPDTFRVTSEGAHVDFDLGSLKVVLRAPPAFEGRDLSVGLFPATNRRRQAERFRGTVSGGRAEVDFPVVLPSRYCIQVRAGYPEEMWAPAAWDTLSAVPVSVTADGPSTSEVMIPDPWYLEGTITGSWQELHLDPPEISAFASDSTNPVGQADLDDGGNYRMEMLLASPVRLYVLNGGMRRWIGGSSFDSATVVQGSGGQVVAGPSYVENAIECRFESTDDHVPSHVDVLLVDSTGAEVTPEGFDPLRHNPMPIPDLSPGTYFLKSLDPYGDSHWPEQWYDGADSLPVATPIRVLPGGTVTRITMHLHPRDGQ